MTKIQLRRDTAANWSTNNPTPSAGEPCFETDTGKLKIGDGITAYNSLPYQGGGGLEVCDIGMALYVDETKGLRRYLNGQTVDINTNTQAFLNRLQQITTLHPSLLCTEEEWQTAKTTSVFGQVGKFVFNYSGDEVVSVRLPRVVNVQGLFDLQNLGMTVDESLPNIWYSNGGLTSDPTIDGALTAGSKWNLQQNESASSTRYIQNYSFSASTCSSTYQDNAPVQQEAIQYPYFIQIATGSETENNIINNIELNNPYSLFDSKYSDHELNNLSWLKSEGQWNSKAVYTDAYDKLLKVYNGTETVEGLSVKLSTETYTDYDFVLNTADETFRLPLLDGSEDLVGDKYDNLNLQPTSYIYTAPASGIVSLDMQTDNSARISLINDTRKIAFRAIRNSASDTYNGYIPVRKGDKYKVIYNGTGSISTFRFIYAQGNGTLYFYIGETVQNANLIDAGRIGEQLATKTDMLQASGAGMPSDRYINLTLGATGTTYTAPANGWFSILWVTSSTSNYGILVNTSSLLGDYKGSTNSGTYMRAFVPARKNDKVLVDYFNMNTASMSFRFTYAEGSK